MSTSQTRKPSDIRGTSGPDRSASVRPAPSALVKSDEAVAADRMAHAAVFVSGVRCVLMYMVLPAAGPVVSQFEGVILPVNVVLHIVTLITTTLAFRRARRSDHPWRRALMALAFFFFVFSLLTMAGELLIFMSPPVAP